MTETEKCMTKKLAQNCYNFASSQRVPTLIFSHFFFFLIQVAMLLNDLTEVAWHHLARKSTNKITMPTQTRSVLVVNNKKLG